VVKRLKMPHLSNAPIKSKQQASSSLLLSQSDAVSQLQGVGPALARKFAVLGIHTIHDLITTYPRRYEDYSVITPTSQLRPGAVTIEAVIKQVSGRYVRRGLHITEAIASDESGSIRIVWFNQPYRATALHAHQKYFISGIYELSHQRFVISNPSCELASDFPINTARIISIYRETKGLSSRQIRSCISQVVGTIASIHESLPSWLITEQSLLSRSEAIHAIHLPASPAALDEARARLGFEEVFQLTLASLMNKRANQSETAIQVVCDPAAARQFVATLPFELTDDQRRVGWQILKDMEASTPMNRLVEGDVGAGKTVVAALAAYMVMRSNFQVALMAPTELLARQHASTLATLFQSLGLEDRIGLLIGSQKKSRKQRAHQAIADGRVQLIIGTHALIAEAVDMHNLALVIIDEQHRFGVAQRKALQQKAGRMPHVLSLTATPIPRSLQAGKFTLSAH
jgi:ATP-dependent DNA helicase RecG